MNALPNLNALPLPALFDELVRTGLVQRLVDLARDEDLGDAGDITTIAWSPPTDRTRARLVARKEGVIAGLAAAPLLLKAFAPDAHIELRACDGGHAAAGDTLAILEGPTRQVLAVERSFLNLVGRLSGVATQAARFVAAIGIASRARVFDTRKTTPGLRVLEKYAVRCGGGFCHRLGLHDAMLVKDNHVARVPLADLAAHAADAARRARADRPLRFVEIEADRLEQVEALLQIEPGLIDLILLDNMPPARLREAVALRDRMNPRIHLEASGGVTLDTIADIARAGVDRISIGALTHSATSLDLALDAE